jgi:hypothetical protein
VDTTVLPSSRGTRHTCVDYLYKAGEVEDKFSRRLILSDDIESMILDTVNAAPSECHHATAQQPGKHYDGGRSRFLPILSGLTFSTVAVLAGLIVWASLT